MTDETVRGHPCKLGTAQFDDTMFSYLTVDGYYPPSDIYRSLFSYYEGAFHAGLEVTGKGAQVRVLTRFVRRRERNLL